MLHKTSKEMKEVIDLEPQDKKDWVVKFKVKITCRIIHQEDQKVVRANTTTLIVVDSVHQMSQLAL